jgi:hypothetical protein
MACSHITPQVTSVLDVHVTKHPALSEREHDETHDPDPHSKDSLHAHRSWPSIPSTAKSLCPPNTVYLIRTIVCRLLHKTMAICGIDYTYTRP